MFTWGMCLLPARAMAEIMNVFRFASNSEKNSPCYVLVHSINHVCGC